MYLIGYDIGSSSVKAALVDAATGAVVARTQFPDQEMEIQAPHLGWAEQDPAKWWEAVQAVTGKLQQLHPQQLTEVKAVGISYQMHGLVLTDKNQQVLRPSIIWCDGRAVGIGDAAFARIGLEKSLSHLLNSPGNFTASKLRWVQENEPELYSKVDKMMLPGDYIALQLTGEIRSTITGLSEGILWDFKEKKVASLVLEDYQIAPELLPELAPGFGIQGYVNKAAAAATGLPEGIPVSYRAGDQPNNALSLNALEPGEVAATGGTSGVVYAITDQPLYDLQSRVNGFAHVNYTAEHPVIGVLMCINGAGIQYSWLRNQVAGKDKSYPALEQMASGISIGSGGLTLLPFGNGPERILVNRDLGARMAGLNFNTHTQAHLIRAGLEGVAFAFVYGMEILQKMGIGLSVMRVGNDNLFQSTIFSETIATLTNCQIEMLDTTGAVGAAKAAGFGAGLYPTLREALGNTPQVGKYMPKMEHVDAYQTAYQRWRGQLESALHS
jgi:xylulokinase